MTNQGGKEEGIMLRKLSLLAILILGLCLVASPALAGRNGPAGGSNTGHLDLYEKDCGDWTIIEGGASGRMTYNLSGPTFDFVFNGHGLEPGTAYTLIYYPDPWPGNGLIVLGSGTANGGGNVHIANSVDTGDLPAANDTNEGAKIWLVLSADVDTANHKMGAWNCAEYLFEYDLITFEDTDD